MTSSAIRARPRWSSPRRPERPTYGPRVGQISRRLGRALLPWQQEFLDLALEVIPETGRLAYREVRLTVPRQSGKTTVMLPTSVWRATASRQLGGRQRMLYAAQTREAAAEKWREDFLEDLKRSPAMTGRFRARLSNGSEAVIYQDGSKFGPVATTETGAHGKTIDWGVIDEAFAQTDTRIEAAWGPAMITRPQAQLWVVSTAGTAASTYLRSKVDSGRQAAEQGLDTGVCYVEYSAPDDADMADPATWWECMPALGFTATEDAVRGERDRMESWADFCRAYGNQWTEQVLDTVIPIRVWRDCGDPGSTIAGRPVLAFDVSPARSSAAIAAAGYRTDGRPHVEIVEQRAGTHWVIPRLAELVASHDPIAVVLDAAGPAGSLLPEYRRSITRPEPVVMTARDMTQACGALLDDATNDRLRHLSDPLLEQALAGAGRRILGDAWAWKRRTSTTDITPLVAATASLWVLQSGRRVLNDDELRESLG
jgi:hypothetical protein